MPKFEVFIPAAQASERSLTLKVDADNWMAALKAGLKRLGQGGAQVANIMVDVMEDNSIHVTEPASGRVFRIKELEEGLAFEELPAPRAQPKQALPGSDAPTPRDMPAIDLPEPPPKAAAKTERPRPPAGPAPSQRPEKAPPARPPPAPPPPPPPPHAPARCHGRAGHRAARAARTAGHRADRAHPLQRHAGGRLRRSLRAHPGDHRSRARPGAGLPPRPRA